MNIDISWYDQHVSPSVNRIALNLEDLEKDVSSCTKCMLHETRHQTVFGEGPICSEIMIVGEAPGKEEDEQGIPFVGRAGKLLNLFLESIDVNRKSVFITNTVKCRPPDNRNPKKEEIDECEPYLINQIDLIQPKLIVALGRIAGNTLLGVEKSLKDMRSVLHKYHSRSLIVTYHPAALLRNPNWKPGAWEDFKWIQELLK